VSFEGEDVLALLYDLANQRGVLVPGGADEQAVHALANHLRMDIPPDLREWLLTCKASRVMRGRLLGISPHNLSVDIQAYLDRHPSWVEKGWIPIAIDATGNPFVLATRSSKAAVGTPVLFIDRDASYDEPEYVAASGLWKFLWFLLQHDQQLALLKAHAADEEKWDEEYERVAYWPFDRVKVVAIDPDILSCTDAPMPWEVADKDTERVS